jgi:hypothetical protein
VRHHAGQQSQLFVAVDLLVGGFFDQATVAIDKQNLAAHARAS